MSPICKVNMLRKKIKDQNLLEMAVITLSNTMVRIVDVVVGLPCSHRLDKTISAR